VRAVTRDDDFGIAFDPLRVRAANGVTLVDGEVVDPDRGKPGLAVCPGGDSISFNEFPAR
jgi:hypothetical protein